MKKAIVTVVLLAALAAPRSWAIFGGGDTATEITQAANLGHLMSQKNQANKQLTTQFLQLTNQIYLLRLARKRTATLDIDAVFSGLPKLVDSRKRHLAALRAAHPLDAGIDKLKALKSPADWTSIELAPTNCLHRLERTIARRQDLAKARSAIARVAHQALTNDLQRIERLRTANRNADGELSAVQAANEATGAAIDQMIKLRRESLARHLAIAEAAAEEEEMDGYRLAMRQQYFARARAEAERMKADPEPEF